MSFLAHDTPRHALTLVLDYPPDHNTGMGTHAHELARGLGRAGWRTTVLVPERWSQQGPEARPAGAPEEEGASGSENVEVVRVPLGAATAARARESSHDAAPLLASGNHDVEARALALVAGGLRPDLIHVHDFYFMPAALRLRARLGLPVVATVHLLFDPLCRWWGSPLPAGVSELEALMCREADALITVSDSMRQLIARTHRLAPERAEVIYNGFDPGPFAAGRCAPAERDELRRRHGLGAGPVVLYAGRIARQKGVRELLRSAAEVVQRRADVTYLIAGYAPPLEADYEGELRALVAATPGLADRVRFVGKFSRHDLPRLYALADLAAVPSVYENHPYSALEAMAAGVPLVATHTGGLPEIVDDGETGLLVPVCRDALPHAPDVGALAEAQLRLLGDPALAARLAARGRERVLTAFSRDAMVDETSAVYEASRARGPRPIDPTASERAA
jgi:alpha-maltose-1-phosphate synthase